MAGTLGVLGIAAILSTIVIGAGLSQSLSHVRGVSLNLGIGDEINSLVASGNQALMQAGILMASNTAVVSAAISTAMAKAKAKLSSLSGPPKIFPIIKSMGPAVFALDVAALAVNPTWFVLNYNGPLSPATATNRGIVWARWGGLMATAPAGSQLDEFPYASTVQGGVGALAAPVPWLQNAVQGGLLSAFYRFSLKSTPGAAFLVVPIPL